MSGGKPDVALVTGDPARLLPLVFDHPRQALAGARAVLAARPSPYDASIALHAIGLVQREFGDLPAALARLRQALRLARRSGSAARVADVQASLGIALVHAGRTVSGLAALHEAAGVGAGPAAARVRFRLGGALWVLGRHQEALAELRAALPVLRAAGDELWVARVLNVRGMVLLALGMTGAADEDFGTAGRLFATVRQDHDSAVTVHNRGLVAFRRGDLPGALALLEQADRQYRSLGTPMPQLVIDRCEVLLAAGMPDDALAEADSASGHLAHLGRHATRRAELLLGAARAAAAAGRPEVARDRAAAAGRLFRAQRRQWWQAHARLILLQARFELAEPGGPLLRSAVAAARSLDRLGSPDAVRAWLLAGRVALRLGRTAAAARYLAGAAGARHRGATTSRVEGWLAEALRAAAAGHRRRTLTACRRGLDLLDEHRLVFGDAELRARATAQGTELVQLGLRALPRGGRPLLAWAERWRATGCTVPPAPLPRDRRGGHDDLAALREIASRLEQARGEGRAVPQLDRERQRLEQRIRSRALHSRQRPAGPGGRPALDIARLLDQLGTGCLVELLAVDGAVHVVLCRAGRVRRLVAGTHAEAHRLVEQARWILQRLAYCPPPSLAADLTARLTALGPRLEASLLGPAARHLGDGPVVVVPPAAMHGAPWALLPSLAERVHTVAPSANAWLQASTAPVPTGDRVVLVRGPNLPSHAGEVSALAAVYRQARLLEGGSATAGRVLEALDGSTLAHIAAHGRFRADSPLFSAMELDDGPLTVYDLARLGRAPYRLVLPCCESARLAPVGADELLGLTAALLPLGTAGIVAGLVAVNDAATVPLMLALHRALRQGHTLAQALRTVRAGAADDPVEHATALSYVALGAA